MRRTIRRHIFGRASAKHESKTTDSSVSRAGGRGPSWVVASSHARASAIVTRPKLSR